MSLQTSGADASRFAKHTESMESTRSPAIAAVYIGFVVSGIYGKYFSSAEASSLAKQTESTESTLSPAIVAVCIGLL